MRTILLSSVLACTVLFSCKKNEYPDSNNNNNNNTKVVDSNAMQYVINGISDMDMEWKDSTILPLSITRTKGNQEKLTLSVTGLPQNVTAKFSKVSGTPDFTTTLTLYSNYAVGGTYALKIIGTTASDSVKNYDVQLIVKGEPAMGCAEKLFGDYSNTEYKGGVPDNTHNTTVQSNGIKNEVMFTGLVSGGLNAKGIIDCDKQTITIPEQPFTNNLIIAGSGTYEGTTMTLDVALLPYSGGPIISSFHDVLTHK